MNALSCTKSRDPSAHDTTRFNSDKLFQAHYLVLLLRPSGQLSNKAEKEKFVAGKNQDWKQWIIPEQQNVKFPVTMGSLLLVVLLIISSPNTKPFAFWQTGG